MVLQRENTNIFLKWLEQSNFKDIFLSGFWGHCILAAAYIINVLPTPVLHGKSPHEVFHKTKPTLQHLRVLGCLCFAKNMYIHDKFQPRSIVAVHMGYSTTTKGYLLYNIKEKQFFISRDVEFRETTFPFAVSSTTE